MVWRKVSEYLWYIWTRREAKTALQELTPKNSFTKAASPLIVSVPLTISITALRQVRYGERCLNIYGISGTIIMINLQHNGQITHICLCWVLQASQPNGAMLSAVSLPNHTFTGQAYSSKQLTSIVRILSPETDNCPSWISGREKDRRKYFMINLHERMLPALAGIEPATSWSPVRCAPNCTMEAGNFILKT